jgi:hypothetical protein
MTPLPAAPLSARPAAAKVRAVVTRILICILPSLAVFYVILSALADGFCRDVWHHDGHWASWSARGILEWSPFLDSSPFSPVVGTGSPLGLSKLRLALS